MNKKTKSKKPKLKILRPIEKESKKKVTFLTADIEAEDWCHFICGGVYCLKSNEYLYSENIKEFVDNIFHLADINNISDVFFHNGGRYDIGFVFDGAFNKSKDYKFKKAIPRGSGFLFVEIENIRSGKKIVFRDSVAIMPMSLKDAGNSFGVDTLKGDMDFAYIGLIFRNKFHEKILTLHEDTYTDASNIVRIKNQLFYDGKEVEKFESWMDIKKMTYKCLKSQNDKDDYRHKIYTKKDLQEYLKKDNISLAQCLEKFYEWDLVKRAGPSFTIAGQALKVSQLFLDVKIYSSTPSEDEFVRKSYFGGRTEIFKTMFSNDIERTLKNSNLKFPEKTIEKFLENKGKIIEVFDVNSLYPTMMQLYDFPYGKGKFSNEYFSEKYGVVHCKVKVPKMKIPPLPTKAMGSDGELKLIFPTGVFEGYWTVHELEYARSLGVEILEIYGGIYYDEVYPIFKNFINTLYSMRMESKQILSDNNEGIIKISSEEISKHKANEQLCKLIMNSTYGKYGTDKNGKEILVDYVDVIKLGKTRTIKTKDTTMEIYLESSNLDNMFSRVIIASYVTSFARIYMHKLIMRIGEDHVYYMDTDSLFIDKKLNESYNDVVGSKLGQLKFEYPSDEAVYILPKTYSSASYDYIPSLDEFVRKTKVKAKGFNKYEVKGIQLENMFEYMSLDEAIIKVRTDARFANIKTSMAYGSFVTQTNTLKYDLINLENKYETRLISLKEEYWEFERGLYHKKANALKKAYEKQKEKIIDKYASGEANKREIKARYTKRIIQDNLIDTVPIHLGEIV